MSYEVSRIAHEVDDIVGIAQEVLTANRWTSPVTTPVGYHEAKALIRKRSLRLPLLGACRHGSVHQHDGRTLAPRINE
jgi:hypothetical protein